MTNPGIGTVDRRDAAIAAALAGMVVIILGYASGVGIKDPDQLVSATPAVTAAPQPAETPLPAAPVAVSPPLTGLPRSYVVTLPAPTVPTPTHPRTHVPATPTVPSETPTPAEPTPSCTASLLDGLPLVGPVVSSLLGGVTPLVSGLLGEDDQVGCALSARTSGGTG